MNQRTSRGKKESILKIFALALAILMTAVSVHIPVKAEKNKEASVEVTAPKNKVLTYECGKSKDFVLNIKNTGTEEITNFVIGPRLKRDNDSEWPFKTEYHKYSGTIKKIAPGKEAQIKFAFTQRDDAGARRYTLAFAYSADQLEESEEVFYVNTSKKTEKKDSDDKKSDKDKSKTDKDSSDKKPGKDKNAVEPGPVDDGEDGGVMPISEGDVGEEGVDGGSVPRVIVTGFTTDPKEVRAGDDFTLTIHLKNTSKKSRVGNMLFDLNAPEEGADEQTTAPAFLSASGSSVVYLEGIKANGTADISINLNAKSDLLQKPYSVELRMQYEDGNFNQVEASSSLSIPVKQDARFEFSDFQINPESIAVEEEANIMCSLYNMGRLKLYNVKAIFEGVCIEKEELFLGHVEPGSTVSIDAMVKGVKESIEDNTVTMTMTYENEEGETFTKVEELTLDVMAAEMPEDMTEAAVEPVEEEKGFPVAPVIGGIAALIAIIAAVFIIKKRKHKKDRFEEEELLYELDGTSEDERE